MRNTDILLLRVWRRTHDPEQHPDSGNTRLNVVIGPDSKRFAIIFRILLDELDESLDILVPRADIAFSEMIHSNCKVFREVKGVYFVRPVTVVNTVDESLLELHKMLRDCGLSLYITLSSRRRWLSLLVHDCHIELEALVARHYGSRTDRDASVECGQLF